MSPDEEPFIETVDNLPPEGQRKALIDLRDGVCRWPYGDPQDKDFFFCGGTSIDDLPYCGYHSRKAYQALTPTRGDHHGGTWKARRRAS